MNFKINTREKFHVITLNEPVFSANMTDELHELFNEVTQIDVKHIILNLKSVQELEIPVISFLIKEQERALEENRSFVICELQPSVKELFKKEDVSDRLNTTPTESEAWDIVQMEEIERELLDGGED
ncbi:MAG: STAS domain-containing protein [Chitinophagaceae bacterium]|nr:STAS domain-containing protein [Chitinophagaceae bacterium]